MRGPTRLRRPHCLLLAAIASLPAAGVAAELRAASPAELGQAVSRARPGDEIAIADGRHADWSATLSCQGTAEQPIVVRPASERGATFTGKTSLRITGRHVVVRGLVFDGCELRPRIVAFLGAKRCRVTECRFLNSNRGSGRAVVTFGDGADDNRVDHCEFIHTVGRCVQVLIGSYAKDHGPPSRNRIDHNLFQDVPPKKGNGRETIQIGGNQRDYGLMEPCALVEHNVFLRCSGEAEIISNKSSRNTYRGNLFKDCRGELVMRGGSHCVIEGNRLEGCSGGIRLSGTHHRVENNVVVNPRGTGIRLGYGTTVELGGIYQAAAHCIVANNTIVNPGREGIRIGFNRNMELGKWGPSKFAPHSNRVERNIVVGSKAPLLLADHAPDNVIVGNLFHATGAATVPTPGDAALLADPKFIDAAGGDYRRRAADGPRVGASAQPLKGGPGPAITPERGQ